MPRFQFTLSDLFLMTTLIAVGLGGLVWTFHLEPFGDRWFVSLLISGASIGAGLFAPIRKKQVGAMVGATSGILAYFWLIFQAYLTL